jgi:hypothetical protein
MINWTQLDRLVVFLEGALYAWIIRVVWKEIIPDIKSWIRKIKKDSTDGTAE